MSGGQAAFGQKCCLKLLFLSWQKMAVYFDHKIQSPEDGGHSLTAWHSNFPVLAATCESTFGGSVNLYLEEVRDSLHFTVFRPNG